MSSTQQQPTLTTANDLRDALSQPGMKWCLKEFFFDYDKAEHLLQAP
jgi:hypothetical protein